MPSTKCCLVGDGAAGKTCLLNAISTGRFPTEISEVKSTEYLVTVNPKTKSTKKMSASQREIKFVDTLGHDEDDRNRPMYYPGTQVFVIAFNIISPHSFEHVLKKWYPEVSRYNREKKPIILVGCKADLRDDERVLERLSDRKLAPITYDQGRKMQQEIKAVAYVECSALEGTGLSDLTDIVLEAAVGTKSTLKKKGKKKCKTMRQNKRRSNPDKKKKSKKDKWDVELVRHMDDVDMKSTKCTVV